MKKSTRNLTLIARGACLGYAICFCLGFIVFYFGGVPLFSVEARVGLMESLCISSYFAFWGMGLGIATELSLESKSFREKLVPYFVGILFIPALISVPIYNLSCLFNQIYSALHFLPISLFVFLGYAIASLYYKKLRRVEFVSYLIAYISLCFVFLLTIILIQVFEHYINNRLVGVAAIYLSFAILSFILSITSVSLTKLLFSKIKHSGSNLNSMKKATLPAISSTQIIAQAEIPSTTQETSEPASTKPTSLSTKNSQ